MKNKMLLIVAAFIVSVAMSLESANAQSHPASVGSTYNYSVVQSASSGTSTYLWTVSVASGAGATYTIVTTNTQSIQWNTAGTYTVTSLETSQNGCPDPSSAQSVTVTVTAAPTINFASASSASCDGASATNLSLSLSFTGTVVYPITVSYTVAGGATRTATVASGTTILLGGTDNILDNATTADVAKAVVITGATAHGAALTVGGTSTHTYTVYGTPTTSSILHD